MKYNNVYIVGGGIQGLVIAYLILQKKLANSVVIYEASNRLGGLAAFINLWEEDLDMFYHHYFPKDQYFLHLIQDLGLIKFLIKKEFPVDYAGLGHSLREKLLLAGLFLTPSYKLVQNLPIGSILDRLGIVDGNLLDLLTRKFGDYYKEVSLAWLWARLRARFSVISAVRSMFFKKEVLYFLKPSTSILINKLVEGIESQGGKIYTDTPVHRLQDIVRKNIVRSTNDAIILTTALPMSKNILQNSNLMHLAKQIPNVSYYSAINILVNVPLNCKNVRDNSYWEHLSSDMSPFVVKVVQHVVFDDLPFKLFYLGAYVNSDSLEVVLHDVKKNIKNIIRKSLNISSTCNYQYKILYAKYASHIPTVEYVKQIPDILLGQIDYNATFRVRGKANILVSSFAQLFPWDRGVNYAIKQAIDVVKRLSR